MAITGFIVGVLGTMVSILALIYAFLAARRSDDLLRRLVVYPFREFDILFAALTDPERSALRRLYDVSERGREVITSSTIEETRTRIPQLSQQMLSYLTEQRWLDSSPTEGYRLNRDRIPYLHFLQESEQG